MQLLAKFKKILYMGFRATLNFRKFKIRIRKKFTVPFLKYKRLKLKLSMFLAGNSVAMVTYNVTKIESTCSPMIGQCFDTMVVASTDKEW